MIMVVSQVFYSNESSPAKENRGCEDEDDNSNKVNTDTTSANVWRPDYFLYELSIFFK